MTLSAKKYRFGLGKNEAFLIRSLAEAGMSLFKVEDASRLMGRPAKETLRRLARKKWVLPLKRGLYALVPLDVGVKGADAFIVHSFVMASLLAEPYYIGYWSALNHHGLTEQIPRTTFIATTRTRHPVKVLDEEYRFVKIAPKKFFGWREIEIDGRRVRLSDPEKTVADCLDHPEHCGGVEQAARAVYFSHEELDMLKLVRSAQRMGNRTILKRLGHILEASGLLGKYGGLLKGFRPSSGYPKLDTLSPARGKHDNRWRLLLNCRLDPEAWSY
jgi:predicted transcriptional regulator of viral defense system